MVLIRWSDPGNCMRRRKPGEDIVRTQSWPDASLPDPETLRAAEEIMGSGSARASPSLHSGSLPDQQVWHFYPQFPPGGQSDFSGLSVDQVGNAAAADSNSFWDRRHFHDPPVVQLPQRPLSFIVGCLSVGILNSSNQVIQLNHSPTLATPPPHLNGRTKKGLEELVYHH